MRPPKNNLLSTSNDADVMEAYLAGDSSAFDVLYGRYVVSIRRLFARTRDKACQEDLVQTAFMRIHAGRFTFKFLPEIPRESAVRRWVFSVALRVRYDEFRRLRRLREDILDTHTMPSSAPEYAADDDRISAFLVAIQALPQGAMHVFIRHRIDGISLKEIAGELGLSESAVKLRVFRAYEQIRKQVRASEEYRDLSSARRFALHSGS